VFVCAHLQAGGVELVNADAHCTEQQTVTACSLLSQCRWSHGSSSCGVGGTGQVLVPSPDDVRVLLMMEVLMTKVQQQQQQYSMCYTVCAIQNTECTMHCTPYTMH
jgi:hypothetical protein